MDNIVVSGLGRVEIVKFLSLNPVNGTVELAILLLLGRVGVLVFTYQKKITK